MDLFEETPINREAALAIGDSLLTDLVLTKSNHAVVKVSPSVLVKCSTLTDIYAQL